MRLEPSTTFPAIPRDLPLRLKLSVGALIFSNLIPLLGVIFLGWSVYLIMIIFWLENIIVGLYNVLKMITARGSRVGPGATPGQIAAAHAHKVFLVPFFIFHYGVFTLVHGVFVLVMFRPGGFFGGRPVAPSFPGTSPFELFSDSGPFAFLHRLSAATGFAFGQLVIPVVALFISHGISYYLNFIRGGERDQLGADDLMGQPYGRVVMLHLTIIIGGFLVMATGSAAPAIAVLIIVKTVIDLKAHLRQHTRDAAREVVWQP